MIKLWSICFSITWLLILPSEDRSFYVSGEKNSDYFLQYQVFVTVCKVRTMQLNNLPRNSFFSSSKQYLINMLEGKKRDKVITKLKGVFNNFMNVSINNQNFIEV